MELRYSDADESFRAELRASEAALDARLTAAQADAAASLTAKERSELIIALAPHVEDFVGELFGIAPELRALTERHHVLAPLYSVKRRLSSVLPPVTPQTIGSITCVWTTLPSRGGVKNPFNCKRRA